MSRPVVLNYPHFVPSFEPRPLRAEEVWHIAESVRRQICGDHRRLKVDVARLIARCRKLQVNGIMVETHWECGYPVHDENGMPVLGATEYDERTPEAVMVYLNAEAIGGAEETTRSTAIHELAHVVFDGPVWIQREHRRRTGLDARETPPERRFQIVAAAGETAAPIKDWREWRANEFMGGYLAPRQRMHSYLHKRAIALGVPLVSSAREQDLPIVDAARASFDALEQLKLDLAEAFGLSVSFMEYRMQKYGLVRRG